MQFDSDNASDSIDLKDLANKEIKEPGEAELPKDTSKTEVTINENKKQEKPIDATKRGTTRIKENATISSY